jgi:hypothetical protein
VNATNRQLLALGRRRILAFVQLTGSSGFDGKETMTTLTIQVDDETLRRVERLAEKRGVSVESAIEGLVRVQTTPAMDREELPPVLGQLRGVAPPMTDEEVRASLHEYRMRKYGGS